MHYISLYSVVNLVYLVFLIQKKIDYNEKHLRKINCVQRMCTHTHIFPIDI